MNAINNYFASKEKHENDIDTLVKDLPELVKTLRDKEGWSQRKLGQILGKHYTTISKIETGDFVPGDEVLQHINTLCKESNASNQGL